MMKKILVIRNDKIGDFMLAWPSFAMLKRSLPDTEITALVPAYTESLARLCPWIDKIMIDPGKTADKVDKKTLIKKIKAEQFDAAICLFSNSYNASLVFKAGIRYRLAPATKIAQIFYNHRLKQHRSASTKPEYQYNLDLIRYFLNDISADIIEPEPPYLRFSVNEITQQASKLTEKLTLDTNAPWCFVHATTGGSADALSTSQYAELVAYLAEHTPFQFVLTAGPGEKEQIMKLAAAIKQAGANAVVYADSLDLPDLARSIACAKLFIAGSTGPLHIAAALDVPTVGFFPANRSATPLRWKPLNSEARHISFCPPKHDDKAISTDMSLIDMRETGSKLADWFLNL